MTDTVHTSNPAGLNPAGLNPAVASSTASATELLADFAAGRRLPSEVVAESLARIAATEPEINAVTGILATDPDQVAAVAAADAYWRGHAGPGAAAPADRPLLGVPVVVKEKHAVAGHPVDQAVPATVQTPDVDHPVVARLRAAGAVLVARTANPEFCAATFTDSAAHGVTRNPWSPEFTPGGSSGGSGAALAAGYAPLATGSDIGGSTRIPATFCGVVGYKAPYGVVPGLHPSTMDWYRSDSAMARTVGDVLLMHNVIAGRHPADPNSVPLGPVTEPEDGWSVAGHRIIVSETLGDYPVDDTVVDNLRAAADALAARGAVIEHRNPDWTVAELMEVAMAHYGHTLAPGMEEVIESSGAEVSPYITQFIDHTLAAAARMPLYETMVRETRIHTELGRLLDGATALITPVTTADALPAEAPLVSVNSRGEHYWATHMAVPFNICNRNPALAVPTGVGPRGVPTGLQIVGDTYDQQAVFRVGFALEDAGTGVLQARGDVPDTTA
ncbi:Acylamidase [Corynebacterium provencense]|uniref:amidase n=1 Tax=Corynebacterium provencense TaxID=1737425 RepID=A0A2Z3YN03_9CORY|nr:amidase [Corynebacterium provencense]AWT25079.1 Acylamidase [Corynebacterium provencense]